MKDSVKIHKRLLGIGGDLNFLMCWKPWHLTAHALTPKDAMRSYEEGAAPCVPRARINDIKGALKDIAEAKEKGKSLWWHLSDRLGSYFEKKFGSGWVSEGEFWRDHHTSKWEKYF